MKKTLFSTLILAALMSSACVAGKNPSKIKGDVLTNECEEKCTSQGKRVDYQYSELNKGECKCSTAGRAS